MKGLSLLLLLFVCVVLAERIALKERMRELASTYDARKEAQTLDEYAAMEKIIVGEIEKRAARGFYGHCMRRDAFSDEFVVHHFCEWWSKRYDVPCGADGGGMSMTKNYAAPCFNWRE